MSAPPITRGPNLPQVRKLVSTIPGPKSQELLARKDAAVAAGTGGVLPISVVAAGGGVLIDADGNSLIDLGSGIAVTGVGNSAPAVVQAVRQQVEQFTHSCFTIAPYEGYVKVAEKLNAITPGDHEKRSALFSTGAEALENAVKIARHYTGKQAVVVFDHAFHGRTNLTMGMTAKNMPYKNGFGPFAPEIYRVPASYSYRDGLTGPEAAARSILQMEKQIGAENVAAVIIEPIQGEGGFIAPANGFLPALQEWTSQNGVILILDEVQTGFARTGKMFAMDHHEVAPDITTMAKSLAGGFPLAAVTGRAEIMDAPGPGGLGGTYGGSPIGVAAAHAVLDVIEDENLCDRANTLGARLKQRLQSIRDDVPEIVDIRGLGFMNAVEFNDVKKGLPSAEIANAVRLKALDKGLILLTCGVYGNVIRFLAPITIQDEVMNEALDILESSISEVRAA